MFKVPIQYIVDCYDVSIVKALVGTLNKEKALLHVEFREVSLPPLVIPLQAPGRQSSRSNFLPLQLQRGSKGRVLRHREQQLTAKVLCHQQQHCSKAVANRMV